MSKLLSCETFPTIKQVLVKLRLCQHTDKKGKKSLIFSSKTDKRQTFTSMDIETNNGRQVCTKNLLKFLVYMSCIYFDKNNGQNNKCMHIILYIQINTFTMLNIKILSVNIFRFLKPLYLCRTGWPPFFLKYKKKLFYLLCKMQKID